MIQGGVSIVILSPSHSQVAWVESSGTTYCEGVDY